MIERIAKSVMKAAGQEERMSEFEWNERMNGNYRLNDGSAANLIN